MSDSWNCDHFLAPSVTARAAAAVCYRAAANQDLLVVVVNTSSARWRAIEAAARVKPGPASTDGATATPLDVGLDLSSFGSTLLIFIRAHLMLHWGNRVAVLTFDGHRRFVEGPSLVCSLPVRRGCRAMTCPSGRSQSL